MWLYIWRHTIHGGSVLVDYWRSVLWKTPMTHYRHKVSAKRDIGKIWDMRSNGTYNFVYSVFVIPKSVVDERLVNQRSLWDGSSEVRCENLARKWKVNKMSGFGVVLLSVWTWWGALLRGLDDLSSEKEKEWRSVLGEQNQFDVGSIYAGPNCSWADLMFQVP